MYRPQLHSQPPLPSRDSIAREVAKLRAWLLGVLGIFWEEPEKYARNIADFGCGKGRTTVALAQLLAPSNIVGIDNNADLIEIADQAHDAAYVPAESKLAFVCADMVKGTGLRERAYDLAFCKKALTQIWWPDDHGNLQVENTKDAILEMARVVKPDGLLVVADYESVRLNSQTDKRFELPMLVESARIPVLHKAKVGNNLQCCATRPPVE